MEVSPSCNAGTPPRRSVRRRLVQSTLFPLKPPEPLDKPEENDDREDEQDEDFCDTANRKKRKPKRKSTPRKKASKNATPKKNASANGIKGSVSRHVLADSDQIDTPVPDLRLEAKLSAEENSRMFAGRQMHPFFSSWKAGKKVQDLSDSGSNLCKAKSEGESITCGPIHVFENIKDDTSSLDWRNWTFLGNTTYVNYGSESSNPSVLEGSVESLNFETLLSTLDSSGASKFQNTLSSSDRLSIHPENLLETLPSSAASPVEQTVCPQMPKDAKVDLDVDESVALLQAGIFRKSDSEPLSRFLQESMRSYYHNCEAKAEGSLWTYKYKPTKAVEVCGNDEAVNFLRDWLHLWHERRYQSRKDASNRDKSNMQDGDDDYNFSHSDYDSEDMDGEDSLQNVLLITGPIGSGKSAAVYACAQEQGFDILELNASDCRNGTVVKQYFGDTLGSLGFKRLSEHTASSQKKNTKLPPALASFNVKAADEVNDGVVELITISDDEAHSPGGTSQKLLGKNNVIACDKVQTLILVEDVDILFPEDRGCIAAIQQIAETARGPIILTSNCDNPGLPDNFDKLHISFSMPTPKELLCHLYTVCLTEGVNIHPLLLGKFIQSCDGDIRKTILHLQFWLQSKRFRKDGKAQAGYGSLPFNLIVGHQILPKMMPWDFPSEISEMIENEFAKSVNIMEENSSLQELDEQYMETDYIKAKKEEMIERNGSITDYSELEIQYNAISEFSNSSRSPHASSRQNGRRKLVVMSSDSEDEDSNNRHPLDTHDEASKGQSIKENKESSSQFQLQENYPSTSVRKLVCSQLEDSEEEHFKYSETAEDTCLNETCKSVDISCVPESTLVPETVMEGGTETMSGAVSSGHLVGPVEVSINNELKPFTFSGRKRLAKLSQNSDLFVDGEIPDSSPKEAVQDFLHENMETTIVKVMDECSRVDFKLKSTFVESSPSMETDMVQQLWRKLRERQMDLRQHVNSEQPGAFQVVKLASRLSGLISEADLFHNHRQKSDIMEPPMFLSGEATSSWYHEQIMMPTIAVHGFCFYAKLIADVGSKFGCADMVDLTSEMLASTTDIMALGKLSRQDLAKSMIIYTGKELELNHAINDMRKSENKTSLFEVIQSIVPARISLALKGDAFNEYLCSLRQISRSEASRIAQCVEKKRRGRVRGAQHYLSRCTMLSSEDISLVNEGDLYRKTSSQYTTNMES
ncbi:P-loop containing nucleoside triphosphate hydrolase [Sesbania bispinosa]|nr:P-loop containing nucleoside triphosphate hydrolase [Sesbania bispinosa]